jgi:parallel beta-helix repeat protein
MRHRMTWRAAVARCAGMAVLVSPAQAKVPGPKGRLGGARWRRAVLVLAVAMAVALSKRQVVPSRLALKVGFRPSPKAALSRVLVLALVVAGFTVLGSGQALASHVSCGDTITTNTTLDGDLVNCPNNGIVIGADNITLDLNSHTVDGDGTLVDPCPEGETCDVGVDNSAGHSGVTVGGGSIRQFALGVLVLSASRNGLRHLSVSRNLFVGIVIGESARTAVEQSSISRNGVTTQQAGMVLFASRDNRIERNLFSGNGNRGLAADSADGNRISHNIFADNPEAGVAIEGDRNQVSHNRVVRNGDNIVVLGNHNAITRNHVANAVGCPAEDGGIGCGFGITFEGGSDNLVARNKVNVVRAAEIDGRGRWHRRGEPLNHADPQRRRAQRGPWHRGGAGRHRRRWQPRRWQWEPLAVHQHRL